MRHSLSPSAEALQQLRGQEATEIIEDYKARSIVGGYTVAKTKVDYKTRKARSGENKGQIEEEWWMVEITVTYD